VRVVTDMERSKSISSSLRKFIRREVYEKGGMWDERGSEAVEFALALSVWMAISFLVMYVSFALYAAHFVANAAEEAARYGSVRGSSWNSASCSANRLGCTASTTDVSDYVKSTVPPGLSTSNLTISTLWPGTTSSGTDCDTVDGYNSPNCLVKVTVSYNFSFPVPFIANSPRLFSSTSQMTIVR
jgi:Flp pilus assembly protein TadG